MPAPRINLGRTLPAHHAGPWPPCVDGFREHGDAGWGLQQGHRMILHSVSANGRYSSECEACGLIKHYDMGDGR